MNERRKPPPVSEGEHNARLLHNRCQARRFERRAVGRERPAGHGAAIPCLTGPLGWRVQSLERLWSGQRNLAVVSRIAAKERVGALQIAAERQIGGRLYEDGGSIIEPGLANSRIDD